MIHSTTGIDDDLNTIRDLRDGWDYGTGLAITIENLDLAEKLWSDLIKNFEDLDFDVCPRPDSSVVLYYFSLKRTFEIEISVRDGKFDLIIESRGKEINIKNIKASDIIKEIKLRQ